MATPASPLAWRHLLGAQNPGRYLKSAFWLSLSKVAAMAVSLLATFYIARTLGPQNFGELSYAQSVLAIFTILSATVGALYRDLVKNPDQEGRLLGTAWLIYFFVSLLSIVSVMVYVATVDHDRLTILVICILCITQFFSPFSVIQNVFYAKTETKWLSIASFCLHVFVSVLKIAAMVLGQGVAVLASIMVLEQALMAVIYVCLYKLVHHHSLWSWRFDLAYSKRLIIDSIPIVFVASSGIISARIDQVFIKHFLDTTTVGLYGMAVQLSEIWQFVPGLVLTAVFPALINAGGHLMFYRKRLLTLATLLTIYGLLISSVLTIGAEFLIKTIYGPAFSDGVILLQIYSWSITGMILGLLSTQFLLAENLRKVQIVSAFIPMVLNVALNLVLIPDYGAPGAAYATVISYSLYPFLPLAFRSVRQRLFQAT